MTEPKPKLNYTNGDLLRRAQARDGFYVSPDVFTRKMNREIVIQFVCECGESHEKVLRAIWENGGGYCKDCTASKKGQKAVATNMQRYGVANPSQNEDIKQKKI
jgi:hypothetical protein